MKIYPVTKVQLIEIEEARNGRSVAGGSSDNSDSWGPDK